MLIFDKFPNKTKAEEFALAAKQIQGFTKGFVRTAQVFDNQEQSDEVEFFPYELNDGPVVLVNRDMTFDAPCEGYPGEIEIEQLATKFGGSFAGT